MHQLPAPDFYSVARLFKGNFPNLPIAMAVIEGQNPGQIWVDNLTNPTCCLLISHAGYSFLQGDQHALLGCLHEALPHLTAHKPISLVWYDDKPHLKERLISYGFRVEARLQFVLPLESEIDAHMPRLPPGCRIEAITAKHLAACFWRDEVLRFYGDANVFIDRSFGVCLLRGDRLVSEAYACFIGGGLVETGSATHPDYRGQGFSFVVREALLRECLKRGFTPASSCNRNNLASADLSRKLGMVELEPYEFLKLG